VNVLGWLLGSDPVLEKELVLLGAHYDHVGNDPHALACPKGVSGTASRAESDACERVMGAQYLGANDDASGVGVLLEIARLWHETGYRPQRSVLFAAWGAQELGELGSRYYAAHPSFPLPGTVAMLQLDAVGGGSGHYMEAQGLWEQEGQLLFAFEVANDQVDGRLKLSTPPQEETTTDQETVLYMAPWEGRIAKMLQSRTSDQVPFRQAGVPTLLITWRGSSEDNWPVGIADEIEPYRLGLTGRMVTFVAMSLAR
jgi:Zn-dependent M28 family amino/carboxypeptidase